jgi:DNA-binding XRE family transcriptional regulator
MATKVKTSPDSKRKDAEKRVVAVPKGLGQPTATKSPQGVRAASKAAAAPKAASPKAVPPATDLRPKSRPTSKSAPDPNFQQSEVKKAKADHVAKTRRELGITQEIFARMIGVSARSVAGWEKGSPINEGSYRRVREMERLASTLKQVMKADFIPQWLVTPNEGMGGISPVQALESGANDRFWRSVFLLGSGLPL